MLFLTDPLFDIHSPPGSNFCPVSLQTFVAPLGKVKVKCLAHWRHTSSRWGRGSSSSVATPRFFHVKVKLYNHKWVPPNPPSGGPSQQRLPHPLPCGCWMNESRFSEFLRVSSSHCCIFRLIPGLTSQNETFKAVIKISYALKPQLNTHTKYADTPHWWRAQNNILFILCEGFYVFKYISSSPAASSNPQLSSLGPCWFFKEMNTNTHYHPHTYTHTHTFVRLRNSPPLNAPVLLPQRTQKTPHTPWRMRHEERQKQWESIYCFMCCSSHRPQLSLH